MRRKSHPWGIPPWTVDFRPAKRPVPGQVDFAVIVNRGLTVGVVRSKYDGLHSPCFHRTICKVPGGLKGADSTVEKDATFNALAPLAGKVKKSPHPRRMERRLPMVIRKQFFANCKEFAIAMSNNQDYAWLHETV